MNPNSRRNLTLSAARAPIAARFVFAVAAGLVAIIAAGCGNDPTVGDIGPAGDYITTARLVMTTGGKRTICAYWKWNNSKHAYEVLESWSIPPGDPHKCLGGAAKVAAMARGVSAHRSIIPDRSTRSARSAADAPTQAFFAGGVGQTTTQYASNQAYLYDAPTDSWRGFAMAHPRTSHTVTALLDGRVLIAGGWDGTFPTNALTSCEIFDPVAMQLAPTGDLGAHRMNHTASLLLDGRVLIAGGTDGFDSFDTAELFDPATGQFSPTGSMHHVRSGHQAVTLNDGRVLVTCFNAVRQAEVYDPNTGTFSTVGSTTDEHGYGSSVTKLDSGLVLVLGGYDTVHNINALSSAEIFDPATNQFTKIGDMNISRSQHCAVLQADGTVFISGGFTANGDTLASAEVYNPADNSFTPSVDLPLSAIEHAGVLLSIE